MKKKLVSNSKFVNKLRAIINLSPIFYSPVVVKAAACVKMASVKKKILVSDNEFINAVRSVLRLDPIPGTQEY
jgi:hypothetical protein